MSSRVSNAEIALKSKMKHVKNRTLAFFQHEAAGGIVLLAAAVLALILANSPLHHAYELLLETPVTVRIGEAGIDKHLIHWINDGLMAVFFLLVGLEIKREMMVGALSSPARASLPAIAALGGMVVPALIYVAFNYGDAKALTGWAIPAATDIAFAVGVLALLGSRVPPSLKIFLLALAIIDDLGAIVIIAVFYTANLAVTALALSALGCVILALINRAGVTKIAPYVVVGVFIWVCVLKSGVHATLAGVATALAVPLEGRNGEEDRPLETLEHSLHTWVTFLILPLFGFANAGVSLAGLTLAKIAGSIPLGIAAGLALGKPIGIFSATWAAVRIGAGQMPLGANWRHVFGVACLGGIGFTMSLFIGMLAFPEPQYATDLRIGVLGGSIVSAAFGTFILTRGAIVRSGGRGVGSE
jgi:NhaA family Na+:H+ antiporter